MSVLNGSTCLRHNYYYCYYFYYDYIITGLLYINFSDGQKIAKKLSFQISKETKSVKKLLEEYSACQSSLPDKIYLPEALDPSFIGNKLHKMGTWGSVASGKKRAIIDAYLAACRSKEEIEMLKEDASNNCAFYERKFEIITAKLQSLSSQEDLFSRGAKALLRNFMDLTTRHIERSKITKQLMNSKIDQHTVMSMEELSSDDSSSESNDLEI